MEAITKKQAQRIAYFGAIKMADQGYSFEPFGAGGIVCRADGYSYSVCLPAGGEKGVSGNCTCKFFEENREYAVCKHIYWAQWQVEAAKAEAERETEEDRIADEATRLMEEREWGREVMQSDRLDRECRF